MSFVNTRKTSNISNLFRSGQIQQVYKLFLKGDYQENDFTWIIGSLCFLGKLDEAIALSKKKKLNAAEYFFLLTAAIRKAQYQETQTWFRKLSLLATKSEENKFFYTQALAFYAYYKCRYKNCLTIVKRSRALSLGLHESFWKVLALDLLGHTYVQMGDIHKGISHLEEAHTLASLLKNTAFLEATEISIINYQAQFTNQPKAHISLIEKKLRRLSKSDNYSESSLLLSLAHLYLLTGEQSRGDKILERAQSVIFSASIPRHKSLWSFERAYYYYLEGSYDLALSFLIQAEEFSNHEIDKKGHLKILGLRRTIFKLLNKNTKDLDQELLILTKMVGDARSINQLARASLLPKMTSEDPLQKLFDQLTIKEWKLALPEIVETGYYGVLREKIPEKKKSYLLTGLWKKGIIILTKTDILIKSEGISEMLSKTLILLSSKKFTRKEEITTFVWGYTYDPIRHDTSIYTLIHRLREVLGPMEKDLVGENHSYHFSHDFKHLDLSFDEGPILPPNELLQGTYIKAPKWNIRQHKALQMIRKGASFKVSDYAHEFNISLITALRDLTELKKAKQVNVYGRARATTYAL